jgi:hypothetical protein
MNTKKKELRRGKPKVNVRPLAGVSISPGSGSFK